MILHETSMSEMAALFPKFPVVDINKIHNLMEIPYEFEKYDPEQVILLNSIIQVMLGFSIYCYSCFSTSEAPIQFEFSNEITVLEFYVLPTVQQLTSIFRFVKPIGLENEISGLWVKEPLPDAITSYMDLLSKGKIDPCMTALFEDKSNITQITQEDMMKPDQVFEIRNDTLNNDYAKNEERLINNKFFMYLLTVSKGNHGITGFPLYGWTRDEILNCVYFRDLSLLFEKIFIQGARQLWLSTQVILINPRNNFPRPTNDKKSINITIPY